VDPLIKIATLVQISISVDVVCRPVPLERTRYVFHIKTQTFLSLWTTFAYQTFGERRCCPAVGGTVVVLSSIEGLIP